MQHYMSIHPTYEELDVPKATDHKIRLVTPEMKYAKASLVWVSDKEVGQYMGADFSNVSLEGEEKRLRDIIDDKDGFQWIIECNGQAVGNININEIEDASKEFGTKAGKLNYLIGDKSLWGKGLTTAIAREVLKWAFSKGGFQIIKSRAIPQNKASIAILEKLGFEKYRNEKYDGPNIGVPTEYVAYKLDNYSAESNS